MARLTKRLKGTTLVETLAASIIIAISFGIGTMVYFNVLISSKSYQTELAEVAVLNLMNTSIKTKDINDQTFDGNNYRLERKTSLYQNPDLYQVTITAYQNKKKLTELKRLIFIK